MGGQNHEQDLEGNDRASMKLPYAQDELIAAVLEARPDTVLVVASGSPVEMPWIHKAKTLVWQWYAGMEGGTALAEVLFGEVNPSGKLPETFPICHMDCSAHCIGEFPGGKTAKYAEGIFVGYRYYDTRQVPVLFPFGYGLSYTQFVYSDLEISEADVLLKECKTLEQDDKETGVCVHVTVSVTNIGSRAGKETVQVYVGKQDSKVERAVKELKAFEKVALEPQETKRITMQLGREAFTYYDVETKDYVVEPGKYKIYVGKNVSEICLQGTCEIR